MTAIARFWSKVDKRGPDECWLWTASTDTHGYGQLRIDATRKRLAHRFAWELANGSALGMCVCHRCDVRRCVNPSHLFLGSNAENVADRHAKGRSRAPSGAASGRAKLTDADVRAVFDMLGRGVTQKQIAEGMGVSKSAISWISTGQAWRHIGAERGTP